MGKHRPRQHSRTVAQTIAKAVDLDAIPTAEEIHPLVAKAYHSKIERSVQPLESS